MAIPFHVSSIPKPQNVYNIQVDNSNTDFPHPWLPRYGARPIHPATRFDPLDFAFFPSSPSCLTKPTSIESTPFKLIEKTSDLEYLATKLSEVEEFAVDLEHNSYRSFQGITCLMQISTRSEDFVVDTLKLWDYIGDYLREFFQDPNKRKVMHGAGNDIMWLQRDFGIYVCNLFDTMQASRVLELERNSLQFLLKYYCGVTANKEYQASDWRLRPLPSNMVKYAREDTHYLLYIHDVMKTNLTSKYSLAEVCMNSYQICVQLYEKEIFDRTTSFLNLYGLSDANLDGKQLAVVSALFEWRHKVASEEDESTGYILPNKLLLEIARKFPESIAELLKIVGNKPQLIRDVEFIIDRIQWLLHNEESTAKFRFVSQQLKRGIPISEIAIKCQLAQRYDNTRSFIMYSHPRCQPIYVVPYVNWVPYRCY